MMNAFTDLSASIRARQNDSKIDACLRVLASTSISDALRKETEGLLSRLMQNGDSASSLTVVYNNVLTDSRDSNILAPRSEEHTSELQSLMRISYAVFCLKK